MQGIKQVYANGDHVQGSKSGSAFPIIQKTRTYTDRSIMQYPTTQTHPTKCIYTYTDADSNTNKAPSGKPRLKQTDIQAARQAHTARHIARHQANMHMYNITCFSNDTDRCQTSGTAAASEFKRSRGGDCARGHAKRPPPLLPSRLGILFQFLNEFVYVSNCCFLATIDCLGTSICNKRFGPQSDELLFCSVELMS